MFSENASSSNDSQRNNIIFRSMFVKRFKYKELTRSLVAYFRTTKYSSEVEYSSQKNYKTKGRIVTHICVCKSSRESMCFALCVSADTEVTYQLTEVESLATHQIVHSMLHTQHVDYLLTAGKLYSTYHYTLQFKVFSKSNVYTDTL